MAKNDLPSGGKRLSQLGAKMYHGILTQGASVPVTMVTAPQFQTGLTAFNNAQDAFGNARKTLNDAYRDFSPAAATLLDWLNAARPIFVSHFGYEWSADWAAAGFIYHSTALPVRIEDRLGLARSIIVYLTANPSFEVPSAGVTAANGTAIRDAAINTQLAVMTAEQALKDSKGVRNPTRIALVQLMRTLIKNLSGKLSRSDPRWLAFGLQMPATRTTPNKPAGLRAQFDPVTGEIILTCDGQPLAQRFRWRGRSYASGLAFQLIARSTEPTARTKPVERGTMLELMVQAVNGASQSVPSDSIFFTVPVETDATAPAARQPADSAATAASPNGSSNGNGNGSMAVSRVS